MNIIVGKKIIRKRGTGKTEKTILHEVDVEISEGEAVAIMGRSGAGKSTLLHQLSALDTPDGGEVLVLGKNVHKMSEDELLQFRLHTFGYVFQDYALVKDLSVIENVQIPLLMRGMTWDEAERIAKETLSSVGLEDLINQKPNEMSGGEQQRVSIARAVAGKPRILFADEPTANLDSRAGQSVIDQFKTLHQQGQTIVMVTHEKEYTNWCNRVLILEDGKIVKEEFPDESSYFESNKN